MDWFFLGTKLLGLMAAMVIIKSNGGSAQIQSFTALTWSANTQGFTEETTIAAHGSDVQLRCALSPTTIPKNLTIRRLEGEMPRNQKHSDYVTNVNMPNIQCKQQGTYVCGNDGYQEEKKLDLAVADCSHFCDNETSPKIITLYARINETKTVSLCLVTRGPTVIAMINKKQYRQNETKHKWTWNPKQNNYDNLQLHIDLTVTNISEENYGNNTFSLSSTAVAHHTAEWIIYLKKPAAPECPTNVKLTNRDEDYITLSWKPGKAGAKSQWFFVLYRKQSSNQSEEKTVNTNQTSLRLAGLAENENYIFRVVPHNDAGLRNDKCESFDFTEQLTTPTTSTTTTTTTAATTANPSPSNSKTAPASKGSAGTYDMSPVYGVYIVLAIAFVFVAIFLLYLAIRKGYISCESECCRKTPTPKSPVYADASCQASVVEPLYEIIPENENLNMMPLEGIGRQRV